MERLLPRDTVPRMSIPFAGHHSKEFRFIFRIRAILRIHTPTSISANRRDISIWVHQDEKKFTLVSFLALLKYSYRPCLVPVLQKKLTIRSIPRLYTSPISMTAEMRLPFTDALKAIVTFKMPTSRIHRRSEIK